MKFKTGDIVFFKGDAIYSNLIKFHNYLKFKELGYTHAGIIAKVNYDKVLIYESLSSGFVKNYYEKWWLENKIISKELDIKSTNKKLTNVYKNAEKYLGRPYAWFDIFGIALSTLFNFRFLKITGANKLICSEAVSRILYDSSDKKINFEKEYNLPFDLISPMHLYKSKYLQ